MPDSRFTITIGGMPRSGNTYLTNMLLNSYSSKYVRIEISQLHELEKFIDHINLKDSNQAFILPLRKSLDTLASNFDAYLYNRKIFDESDLFINQEIDKYLNILKIVNNNIDNFTAVPFEIFTSDIPRTLEHINKRNDILSNFMVNQLPKNSEIIDAVYEQDKKFSVDKFLYRGHIPRNKSKTKDFVIQTLSSSRFIDIINNIDTLQNEILYKQGWRNIK